MSFKSFLQSHPLWVTLWDKNINDYKDTSKIQIDDLSLLAGV